MSKRVVLFFNHAVPHTTGHYWASGFRQVPCAVDVMHPAEAAGLKPGSYDLYLAIDDATHYLFPEGLHPSAFSLADPHMTYSADKIMARRFDFVFCVQKFAAERLRRDGFPGAVWLPIGCAPELHPPPSPAKKYDVAFIGAPVWGRRRRLLEAVKERFPNSFIGTALPAEMARIYGESRIVFNCSVKTDLNMRVFEAMASGACLVANLDATGLTDLFKPGVHFAGYGSPEEALDVIARYLGDEAGREEIARTGRAEVLAKHTYRHRAEEILRLVFADGAPPQPSPRRLPPRAWDAARLKLWDQAYKLNWRMHQWLDR